MSILASITTYLAYAGLDRREPHELILLEDQRAAVQRVVTVMNQMDRKKHEKFANQFNYALN